MKPAMLVVHAAAKRRAFLCPIVAATIGAHAQAVRARVVRVGFGEANDWVARNTRVDDSGATFSVQCRQPGLNGDYHTQLLGRHQVASALFALALGAELGIGPGGDPAWPRPLRPR